MRDKDKILNQFIGELERSSPETRRVRKFWAEKFLQFAGNRPLSDWNKKLVYDFEARLRKERYAPLSIRDALGVVKRVFDAAKAVDEEEKTKLFSQVDVNDPSTVTAALMRTQLHGPRWDVGKRWKPRVDGSDIARPALTLDEIEKMVTTAKQGKLEVGEAAFFALASVYGLRREELRQVRREDIDFSEKTIFVNTCKGGEKRKQLLCDEIIPILKEYSFGLEYSPFMLSRMFKQICDKSGVENRDGMGFHAFRRYLDTALRDSLASDPNLRRDAQLITKIFFRWRLSSSSEMTDRYYTAEPLLADKIALEHHPVVRLLA